jgi:hypothetical protein
MTTTTTGTTGRRGFFPNIFLPTCIVIGFGTRTGARTAGRLPIWFISGTAVTTRAGFLIPIIGAAIRAGIGITSEATLVAITFFFVGFYLIQFCFCIDPGFAHSAIVH